MQCITLFTAAKFAYEKLLIILYSINNVVVQLRLIKLTNISKKDELLLLAYN